MYFVARNYIVVFCGTYLHLGTLWYMICGVRLYTIYFVAYFHTFYNLWQCVLT